MTLEPGRATFDIEATRLEAIGLNLKHPPAKPQPAEDGFAPVERTPELIEQLARLLSAASGEDPDEQPYPLRFPRWRFYCTRAKALLSITPSERRALTAVLGRQE